MKTPMVRGRATPWHWIEIVCFTQPDIDGSYFSTAPYTRSPNIQNAFETLDKALGEARDQIKTRLEKSAVDASIGQ